ncbi:phage-related regulatory protein [Gluconacetobacter liquefaciens]|uniref:AAA domain-containing protein n=1 Tax=Gluconacetobacter liquefaciens TaxID=89584 RepID=A0A370G5X9_GLULI|nr:AAA family ATPase [Gluconacetobacter liquefaciens]MBB2186086.1 AAA family ATPase [Gluconacetobacter liquefaciens]RDI38620.1 AAA domain-containing protein [Gluconacetobacter liquefaciens]GBR02535.1 phage-related regulatory protein [Gluconacetobacter liquefaciens NRIC 0522]GEB37035.1 phage-related regulatory protein [Gluconacetobacter liquefaciens]
MKSVAFFNNKGGVGKTTLLCNVAAFIAKNYGKKVCVVDADPQCNATQYFFDDESVNSFYSNSGEFTVYKMLEPLSLGEGYSDQVMVRKAPRFEVDVLPGDPRLALTEDLLANDWGSAKAGDVRGIRTSLAFSELLKQLSRYDYVLFDVSPSLGAINRSIMLSADYFISPVSLDIFSLKAFENIASWIEGWWREWENGLKTTRRPELIPNLAYSRPEFIGYVTQSYLAKRDKEGQRRAVQAYENIRQKIDQVIIDNGLATHLNGRAFEIGTVPNLFSLVPMSQSSHAPIFSLTAGDGVVGAHFAKVKEARDIFGNVTAEFLERTQ